jgi:regulator of protease activity HflC (stomatin/prohibitin superfamily)
MKKSYNVFSLILVSAVMLSLENCSIVRPGQVGFRQRLGVMRDRPLTAGIKIINPFTTRIVKMNTRIKEYSATLPLPTKEGFEITAAITLLYQVKPDDAYDVYVTIGKDFEKRIIITNFNAIAREVCVKFYAKELIPQKDSLEVAISRKLTPLLMSYGITVDQIIVRDIELPNEITQAIKNRITAEQTTEQAEIDIERRKKEFEFDLEKQKKQEDFNIEKQKQEAEITLIQAIATRKANDSINLSLTDRILKLKSIEATSKMLQAPNTKLIITDGKSPVTIHADNMGTK